MPKRDLYAVLGVSRGATDKEIRQAYRRLAREYHPDLNPDNRAAEDRFKEISEAYEVLSDSQKRAQYDRFGHFAASARPGAPNGSGFGNFSWAQSSEAAAPPGMEDLIEQLLHGGGRKRPGGGGQRNGQDVEQTIEVSLAEAMTGTTRRVQVSQPGAASRMLDVTIQPGVDNGTRIRVAGQGAPGRAGGRPGDMYLIVRILPDERFQRRGADLHTVVDVPFYRAALGGEVEVPTPRGTRLALSIPPETQNGSRFRLAGQGMPRLSGTGRGDLYAEIRATLPEKLTNRERELIRELATIRGE